MEGRPIAGPPAFKAVCLASSRAMPHNFALDGRVIVLSNEGSHAVCHIHETRNCGHCFPGRGSDAEWLCARVSHAIEEAVCSDSNNAYSFNREWLLILLCSA